MPNEIADLAAAQQFLLTRHGKAAVTFQGGNVTVRKICGRCDGTGTVRPWGRCFRCGGYPVRSEKTYPTLTYARQVVAREARAAAKREATRLARLAADAARVAARETAGAAWLAARPDVAAALARPAAHVK